MRNAAGGGVGHVADALLRGADLPLLVTRSEARPVGALKRLVVPLSGEPSTSAAMRFAEDNFCAHQREIVAEAEAVAADLVVLVWSRELEEGTSRQVKELLERAPCPLLLVPETAPLPD